VTTGEYEDVRRVCFGEGATFVPVCHKCGRFVRPYKRVTFNGDGQPVGNNAHCKRCGRTRMLFEGYY
jgi:hypothetical protein